MIRLFENKTHVYLHLQQNFQYFDSQRFSENVDRKVIQSIPSFTFKTKTAAIKLKLHFQQCLFSPLNIICMQPSSIARATESIATSNYNKINTRIFFRVLFIEFVF